MSDTQERELPSVGTLSQRQLAGADCVWCTTPFVMALQRTSGRDDT